MWRLMSSLFRSAAPSMLLEAESAAPAKWSGKTLVLSRALCRYRFFRPQAGLRGGRLASAARIFAQAHAPFERSGSVLMRTPLGVGVWWWDEAKVAAACGGKPPREAAPETVLRAAGDGWRIISCEEGFEAQYWEAGALLASSWRRAAFTREQWTAFALGLEAPAIAPPELPPALEEARLGWGGHWRRSQIKAPVSWGDAESALVTAGICAAALAAFFAAQAWRYEGNANANRAAAHAIDTRMNRDQDLRRVRERTALLQEYQAAAQGLDVLGAATDVMAVLGQFGLVPEAWSVDQTQLRVSVRGEAGDFPLRDVVAAIENTPSLCGVEPVFREGMVDLSASLSCEAPP
ncbi:MAG: hypothetical protein ABL883_11525, partial [Terricaulis sp.]